MRRALFVLGLISCNSEPPSAPNEWFPLSAGRTWTFRISHVSSGGEYRGTATLTCVRQEGPDWILEWSEAPIDTPAPQKRTFRVRTTASAIFVSQATDFMLMIVPMGPRCTVHTPKLGAFDLDSTIEAEEPRSTYSTRRVRCRGGSERRSIDSIVWYGKGVGPVEMTVQLQVTTPSNNIDSFRTEAVLTSVQ